jgi:hypothetical protein
MDLSMFAWTFWPVPWIFEMSWIAMDIVLKSMDFTWKHGFYQGITSFNFLCWNSFHTFKFNFKNGQKISKLLPGLYCRNRLTWNNRWTHPRRKLFKKFQRKLKCDFKPQICNA